MPPAWASVEVAARLGFRPGPIGRRSLPNPPHFKGGTSDREAQREDYNRWCADNSTLFRPFIRGQISILSPLCAVPFMCMWVPAMCGRSPCGSDYWMRGNAGSTALAAANEVECERLRSTMALRVDAVIGAQRSLDQGCQ